MKSTICYKTEKGSSYYLDMNKELVGILHPELYRQIRQHESDKSPVIQSPKSDSPIDYYEKKYQYLLSHGFFQKKNSENEEIASLTPEMIEGSLANTEQIVFEVTDKCNLRCKYCGYRDMYSGYDQRENKNLDINAAIEVWNQVNAVIKKQKSVRTNDKLIIGFYGGEPLLNFEFIRQIASYIKQTSVVDIQFNMTTNAMLLDKYMDFLIQEDFSLLISLDGDYDGNSYRVTADNKNPHAKVVSNIDLLQQKAPEYFEKRVQFNAVLHNANSIYSTYHFIHERYGKKPHISEMSTDGIVQKERFEEMRKDFVEDFMLSTHKEEIFQAYFADFPLHKDIDNILRSIVNGSILSIWDLISYKQTKKLLTGTCLPFSKKVFITVNGKLLVCEKIDHVFALGQLNTNHSLFDFAYVANKYNAYYKKIQKSCQTCYYKKICSKCIFSSSEEMKQEVYTCSNHMNEVDYCNYMAYITSFLEEYPTRLDQYMF